MGNIKTFWPVGLLFVLTTSVILLGGTALEQLGFNKDVLLWGNLLLFVISGISLLLLKNSVKASSPQAFVRHFYISFLIKFMLVAISALIYAKTTTTVNRASVIACMVLYLVYTFFELRVILKASKHKHA